MDPITVTVQGRTFAVRLPALDLREDLVLSYHRRSGLPLLRVCAAAVALCVPEVDAFLRVGASPRADLYVYGGEVYNALRAKGWVVADIRTAGDVLVRHLAKNLFPQEAEIETARGN